MTSNSLEAAGSHVIQPLPILCGSRFEINNKHSQVSPHGASAGSIWRRAGKFDRRALSGLAGNCLTCLVCDRCWAVSLQRGTIIADVAQTVLLSVILSGNANLGVLRM